MITSPTQAALKNPGERSDGSMPAVRMHKYVQLVQHPICFACMCAYKRSTPSSTYDHPNILFCDRAINLPPPTRVGRFFFICFAYELTRMYACSRRVDDIKHERRLTFVFQQQRQLQKDVRFPCVIDLQRPRHCVLHFCAHSRRILATHHHSPHTR